MKTTINIIFCSLLSTFMIPGIAKAQEKKEPSKLRLSNVLVRDNYSGELLPGAKVSVWNATKDTLLLAQLDIREINGNFSNFDGWVPLRGQYVLRAEMEGYVPAEFPLKVKTSEFGKPMKYWEVKRPITLNRVMKTRTLGEASVTASRIMMVTKGDTTIYYADAFNLPEGSMLDALISRIPGAKIDCNGRITIDGQFYPQIMVNGRKFFDGNPQVALHNLPSYTVHTVKTYPFLSKNRELSGDTTNLPMVLDVRLKRQYMRNWLSNYEVGGGSKTNGGGDALWLARLFALRYTKQSSLAFYGSANNLNDAQRPGKEGEWQKIRLEDGNRKTQMGGVDFRVEGSKSGWKYGGTLEAKHQTMQSETESNDESYYSSYTLRRHERWTGKNSTTNASLNNDIEKAWRNSSLDINVKADYQWGTETSHNSEQQYEARQGFETVYSRMQSASALEDLLLQREQANHSTRHQWQSEGRATYSLKAPWNGHFTQLTANYHASKTDYESWKNDRIAYTDASVNGINTRQFYEEPSKSYDFSLNGAYLLYGYYRRKTQLKVTLAYQYKQTFASGHRTLENVLPDGETALPPSGDDALNRVLDLNNSFHTTERERSHQLQPKLEGRLWGFLSWKFTPQFKLVKRHIYDFRASSEQSMEKRNVVFDPELSFNFSRGQFPSTRIYQFSYRRKEELPLLQRMLDVTDTSNPLVRRVGNPTLKNAQRQTWAADMTVLKMVRPVVFLRASYSKMDHAIGTTRSYDPTSGITTYRPENINGNRSFDASCRVSTSLDKMKRWELNQTLSFTRQHSVDFNSFGTETAERMAVNNNIWSNNLELTWQVKKSTLGFVCDLRHTHQHSAQSSFGSQSFMDISYGLTATTPLVWHFSLNTDLTAYTRRGYADHSMNTTDWVWNAAMSRPLGRKQTWVMTLRGYDILHQISNVRRSINSQGRTETWYSTIPSYVMLQIQYHLVAKPKGKK